MKYIIYRSSTLHSASETSHKPEKWQLFNCVVSVKSLTFSPIISQWVYLKRTLFDALKSVAWRKGIARRAPDTPTKDCILSSKEPTEHELVLSGNSKKSMFQHLGAGIAMMIFRLHRALSQQDKLDSCIAATPKIVISMSLVTCTKMMLSLWPQLLFPDAGSEEATGLVIRFIISRTGDKAKVSELVKEVAKFDDFMLLDIKEEYSFPSLKPPMHFMFLNSMSKLAPTYI
ncbi:uncharacterized protein LOC108196332 isoform X2 [Daucus carota subsp. sativus]|uniref:uncharacterized protein LOC108196332 isoform X2 n=1 Tax=Daucus carota subsp. sativus TaxID=79200 RepID=UPI0030829AFC